MTAARMIAAGLFGLLLSCRREGGGPGGAQGAGAAGPPPMPVEVVEAREDTVVDAILATGEVEAIQSVDLRSEVEGRISEVLMREGMEVARGAPLFQVDDQELRAQVARAEAERDLAEQTLARTRVLMEQTAASPADLERAEAAARSARASLALLAIRLRQTTVRAPFAGVLGQRMVSPGDYVTTARTLVTVRSVNPQRVAFTVPERYAGTVRQGQRVAFRVAALPGEDFEGTVDFVSPAVQLPARTLLVKATVPNGRRRLQAGMFIEARLATAVRPRAVIVPEEAILGVRGEFVAWAVDSGKAVRRPVSLGVRSPGEVEITSGLSAGEQVVVGGLERLRDGAPVQATLVERKPARRGE